MRSNRPLTQFAVKKLLEFLTFEERQFTPEENGNTAVSLERDSDFSVLTFWLHQQRIMEVVFDGPTFAGVNVYDGGFYDRTGGPSTTTRERLNGLLDELGEQCLIPEGVRVFQDKASGTTFVGRGDVRAPLGRDFAPVSIDTNPVRLTFS